MFTLDISAEPYWIDLPMGVRVRVRPLTAQVLATAQAAAAAHLREMDARAEDLREAGLDATIGLDNLADPAVRRGVATVATVRGLARYGVMDWEGVGGDGDVAMPCTPDNAARLVEHAIMMQPFLDAYTKPVVKLDVEGNGSAPVQSGSLPAGANTAAGAPSSAETALLH